MPNCYRTIDDIKHANRVRGFYFFDPPSMRFFRSRVLPTVYGGRYFITSEQTDMGPRMYTVREYEPETGNVKTATGTSFMAHFRRRDAIAVAKRLLLPCGACSDEADDHKNCEKPRGEHCCCGD